MDKLVLPKKYAVVSLHYGWRSWKIPLGILDFVRHRYGFHRWVPLFWDTWACSTRTPRLMLVMVGSTCKKMDLKNNEAPNSSEFTLPATNSSPSWKSIVGSDVFAFGGKWPIFRRHMAMLVWGRVFPIKCWNGFKLIGHHLRMEWKDLISSSGLFLLGVVVFPLGSTPIMELPDWTYDIGTLRFFLLLPSLDFSIKWIGNAPFRPFWEAVQIGVRQSSSSL